MGNRFAHRCANSFEVFFYAYGLMTPPLFGVFRDKMAIAIKSQDSIFLILNFYYSTDVLPWNRVTIGFERNISITHHLPVMPVHNSKRHVVQRLEVFFFPTFIRHLMGGSVNATICNGVQPMAYLFIEILQPGKSADAARSSF